MEELKSAQVRRGCLICTPPQNTVTKRNYASGRAINQTLEITDNMRIHISAREKKSCDTPWKFLLLPGPEICPGELLIVLNSSMEEYTKRGLL
jgi:hypothetical protein